MAVSECRGKVALNRHPHHYSTGQIAIEINDEQPD